MMKLGLFLVGFVALVAANDVTLSGDKWAWVIQNFSGFNYWRRNTTWTISTDSSSTIKVFCLEIKLPTVTYDAEDCRKGKLVFDDGVTNTTYCRASSEQLYRSNSSKLVVNLVVQPNYGGVVYCKGKSVHAPRTYETIDVKPDSTTRLVYPKVLEKDNDQAFLFNSTSGSPITLSCTKNMERPLKTGECVKDILTIDAGNGPNVSCGKGEVSVTGTQIKMRVETYQATSGRVSCVVKG